MAWAWDTLTLSTLNNALHNLWPRAIFDDNEGAKNFEEFNISHEKNQASGLLRYAKGVDTSKEITKNLCLDINDWMHCDTGVPVVCQMTDEDFVLMVMKPSRKDNDESDSGYTREEQHGCGD